jgi:(p)ppGpp synthase/HD superfamily hydrolase
MLSSLDPEPLTDEDRNRFAAAIAFAERAHRGQLRKGTTQPYAVHPLEVGALLAHLYPARPALVSAGFLHDTIEDTRVRREELAELFGAETARLVVAVTKRWYRAPWSLDTGDADVVRLKAADCVSNIRATVVGLREQGPSIWRRFSGGEKVKRDYYRRLTWAIGEAIPGEPLARRLVELNGLLEAERPPRRH